VTGEAASVRYRSWSTDSARWEGFEFRSGDIVISTPPKAGTTWTQMLCGLLIFGGPEFPAALDVISPWIDQPSRAIADVRDDLARQRHRRFVKTHTPLDGIPQRDDVIYLVVGRDPRDIAVSFHHHRVHMDFERFLARRAATVGLDDLAELPPRPPAYDELADSFRHFIDATDPAAPPPTLRNVLHHLDTGWRRRDQANVALFHYADYLADLPGELRRLAAVLAIELDARDAERLAGMAGIAGMRRNAAALAPNASDGFWDDPAAFFRSGGGGEWRGALADGQLAEYTARVSQLASPGLAEWAHGGRLSRPGCRGRT
jgi:aryl sulfotransferase